MESCTSCANAVEICKTCCSKAVAILAVTLLDVISFLLLLLLSFSFLQFKPQIIMPQRILIVYCFENLFVIILDVSFMWLNLCGWLWRLKELTQGEAFRKINDYTDGT